MKIKKHLIVLMLLFLSLLTASLAAAQSQAASQNRGKIVVANRASGSISVISTATDELLGTYALPAGENSPEPMYVVFTRAGNRVFVGDRANNQVVVFRARDFSVETTIPAGAGVFHMWADGRGTQIWVSNDINNTITVINPRTLTVEATVPLPADLVAMGGKPHDVILDAEGNNAYVTMLGFAGDNDYVVHYDTNSFAELNRAPVGKDPHLSLTFHNEFLYVPAQNSDLVSVFNRQTLGLIDEIDAPGAHGAGMPLSGQVLYTTNLPGGGSDGLIAIDLRTNTVLGTTDTPYGVPHNIALTPAGDKLYVTHSGGTSDKVTVYDIGYDNLPTYAGEVTVEFNPFGLSYVP
ncbi:beta-propeller fold lactonase family protein [Candidatus Leptofilum sp.]|uniref:YncE family protein n=1 Tax=Candidatus Leptofilum sp. TaxID=3241576 RepID=UPI003B5A14FD